MDEQLVIRYLRGEATEEEVSVVFQWIEASTENRKEFIGLKKIWALTASDKGDTVQAWQQQFGDSFKKQKQRRIIAQVGRYAAMFLLLIGLGVAIQYLGFGLKQSKLTYPQNTVIAVPPGQITNVELPDGTKVMLNSGSSISYNGNFAMGERVVTLTGEGYFDVATDKAHPFIVETPLLNFKVFGTSFNIEAYPGDSKVSTTLIEGSLGVLNKANQSLHVLTPGQNASFDVNSSKLGVTNVNVDLYTSWKEGLMTFRNEKLKDIALKIERWYNVQVVIKNPKLGEEAYFGTIMKSKPIDQILEVLKLTSSLHYKIETRADKQTVIYWY